MFNFSLFSLSRLVCNLLIWIISWVPYVFIQQYSSGVKSFVQSATVYILFFWQYHYDIYSTNPWGLLFIHLVIIGCISMIYEVLF